VSLPLEAAPSAAPEGPDLDGWFAALGKDYVGRVPAGSLRPGMVDGWRLRWRGRDLEVQVPAQPVDATLALNLCWGFEFRGLGCSLSWRATLFR